MWTSASRTHPPSGPLAVVAVCNALIRCSEVGWLDRSCDHGFTAHVMVEPDTGLITATALTAATGAANSEATIGLIYWPATTASSAQCRSCRVRL
jgi:hypothetical protein